MQLPYLYLGPSWPVPSRGALGGVVVSDKKHRYSSMMLVSSIILFCDSLAYLLLGSKDAVMLYLFMVE